MHIKTTRGWMPLPVHCSNSNDLQGVFVVSTLEEVRRETAVRSTRWSICMSRYCKGEYGGDHGWEDMWRDMKLTEPLYGAFGEKL